MLEEGVEGVAPHSSQTDEPGNQQGAPMHQGNDESYINGPMYSQQGYSMMHTYGGPAQGQQYYYDGNPNNPNGRMSQQGHLRKDSNANLPPPDVARGIPCKFFPNCRYGDKCMFAHPIMAMPSTGPPGSAPLSPSMSQPPMQPIFYQQIPNGYPYPGPYGAGPQFYPPMGPMNPLQQHYGMPAHFNQSMVQPMLPQQQQQQQLNIHVDPSQMPVFTGEENVPVKEDEATSAQVNSKSTDAVFESSESRSAQVPEQLSTQGETVTVDHEKDRISSGTPPQQDEAAPLDPSKEEFNAEESNGIDEKDLDATLGKPVHRRQSFNSFLHHHAVPFQPTLQPGVEAGMVGIPMQQNYPPRMGNKTRRAPGVNGGFPKRHNKERPACTFFAAGRCRFGEECLFPHILPDGTDARPMQAQQRQLFAVQYGSTSTGLKAANGVNGTNGNINSGVPASAPTGPQAEKKAAAAAASEKQLQQQPQQSQQKQDAQQLQSPQQTKNTSQSSSAAVNGASVVRSNPSKTSTQAANTATSSRGAHGNTISHQKKHQNQSQQPAQRIPTVNDFPALAVPSTNGGQTTLTPLSPSLPFAAIDSPTVAATTSTLPIPAPPTSTAPSSVPSSSTPNGGSSAPARANFSAILSAPAPVKPRQSAESSNNSRSATIDEENQDSDGNAVRVNVDEKMAKQQQQPQSQAKSNGLAKDSKTKAKEVKASKVVDSYKGAATGTNKASTTTAEDDDFQLVHRSRSSTKRSSSNQNNSNSGDTFAAQAKAVAA